MIGHYIRMRRSAELRKTLCKPESVDFVKRDELLQILRKAGTKISKSALRRYQAMGLLPPPRPYGRVGRGRGVDWGWPPEQAREIATRVRLLRKSRAQGKRLVELIADDPAMSSFLADLIDEARATGYEEGFRVGFDAALEELRHQHPEDLEPPDREDTEQAE